MALKEKLTFFYALEENIWNDKVEANPYLGTLSILLSAIIGALVGGGNTLAEMFEWDVAPALLPLATLVILLWGLNIAESIIASSNGWVALGRSILILLSMAIALALGIVLAVVVIFVVVIILVFLLASGMLKAGLSGGGGSSSSSSSSSNSEEGEVLDFGMGDRVKGRSSWDGNTFWGDNGRTYEKHDGGWIEKD